MLIAAYQGNQQPKPKEFEIGVKGLPPLYIGPPKTLIKAWI